MDKPVWRELYDFSHKHLFCDLSLFFPLVPGHEIATCIKPGNPEDILLLFAWEEEFREKVRCGFIGFSDADKINVTLTNMAEWWHNCRMKSLAFHEQYSNWVLNKKGIAANE